MNRNIYIILQHSFTWLSSCRLPFDPTSKMGEKGRTLLTEVPCYKILFKVLDIFQSFLKNYETKMCCLIKTVDRSDCLSISDLFETIWELHAVTVKTASPRGWPHSQHDLRDSRFLLFVIVLPPWFMCLKNTVGSCAFYNYNDFW